MHGLLVHSPSSLTGPKEMKVLKQFSSLRRFDQDQEGATAVEYAVMLALLVGVCILAITTLGDEISTVWTNGSNEMSDALGN